MPLSKYCKQHNYYNLIFRKVDFMSRYGEG